MKKLIRCGLLTVCLFMGVFLQVQTADAAEKNTVRTTVSVSKTGTPGWYTQGGYKFYYNSGGKLSTGWVKIKKELYYFRKTAEGNAPAGSMVTGFVKIDKKYFYLSENGILQTGWMKINKKYYYFAEKGASGVIGGTYTGLQTVDGHQYFFAADGSARTGWIIYKSAKYYCTKNKNLGWYGQVDTGWHKISNYWYYFNKKGVLQTNKWVGSYYVNSDGRRLTSAVTPDGWIVDKNGLKTKKASGWVKSGGKYYYYKNSKPVTGWQKISGKYYYFNSKGVRQDGLIKVGSYKYYLVNGVRQSGWFRIDGKRYYFKSNGRMAVNTTVDGIRIGPDGTAEITSILIIAGHGQGDAGASSVMNNKTYLEYKYNREFASLIYKQLQNKSSKLSVTMYDQDYDCYQVVAGKKAGPSPDFDMYDYVLEVHFNATVESNKDLKGDGAYKGVGMYINSAKSDYTLEARIVSAVAATGFKQWGCGVYRSSGLLNAKTCQAKGVSYGLLETAFIDDRDDMNFYQKKKSAMAKAVANTILSYYGLG